MCSSGMQCQSRSLFLTCSTSILDLLKLIAVFVVVPVVESSFFELVFPNFQCYLKRESENRAYHSSFSHFLANTKRGRRSTYR